MEGTASPTTSPPPPRPPPRPRGVPALPMGSQSSQAAHSPIPSSAEAFGKALSLKSTEYNENSFINKILGYSLKKYFLKQPELFIQSRILERNWKLRGKYSNGNFKANLQRRKIFLRLEKWKCLQAPVPMGELYVCLWMRICYP